MKFFILLIFIVFVIQGHSQERKFKVKTLTQAFNIEPDGTLKDYCTSEYLKMKIVFSGNVNRIAPERANKLYRLYSDCGFKPKERTSKLNMEILATEKGIQYSLQVNNSVNLKLLKNIDKGASLIVYGQMLTEHTRFKATSFFIIDKIEK